MKAQLISVVIIPLIFALILVQVIPRENRQHLIREEYIHYGK